MAHRFERRTLLRAGAMSLAAVAGAPILAACSNDDTAPAATASGTPAPRSGGTLRAAFVGGGAAETLNYLFGPTGLDYVRARSMHGALGVLDPTAEHGVRYGVLERIDISDDLSTYTVKVRPGVTFTDGTTLTARDVLYSLNAPVTLGSLPFLKPPSQNFDLAAASVDDDLTLVLPTLRPIADGRLVLCQSSLVFKDGTTEFTPDMPTCGPFKLVEFEPGQGAAFARHDDYYGLALDGGPYLDGLELRTIPDAAARVNALTGGQVDFVSDIGPVAARTVGEDERFAVAVSDLPYATSLSFGLNLSFTPFADVRVRQAVKYAIDREAIVRNVFFGRAFVGNDLPSLGFTDYAEEIEQRPYDPDRAKALLSEAGVGTVKVAVTTAPEVAGMAETATVVVENLKAVGIDATLDQRPPGQLFSDFAAYTQLPFAASYTPPVPPLSSYAATRTAGSPSTFGFNRPDIDELVAQARGAVDADQRRAAAVQAQQLIWEEGNQVIPVFAPSINGQVATVHGVRDEPFSSFEQAYLA
ncbi:ABC transporter substrate-binding protein [Solwaraspora sp. WMMA2080]|uniref:ABC transporter substrate-binding protein n=1 Tax=unclassified Solwaraspora TaxID=2627926 RepID=UPI00248CE446|nr:MULTISPECIES: ABC transporter substrate-binding protein [unclassified Solwaraspora]WBB99835.1 ABC transporter substrate-binding protein [Solwaraspora sp. WMMA2059]WBC21617.1 ABC transporter substrate-binding protein [Solwaraspora sp. WMMA2080]